MPSFLHVPQVEPAHKCHSSVKNLTSSASNIRCQGAIPQETSLHIPASLGCFTCLSSLPARQIVSISTQVTKPCSLYLSPQKENWTPAHRFFTPLGPHVHFLCLFTALSRAAIAVSYERIGFPASHCLHLQLN